MIQKTISKVYSKALFELAQKENHLEETHIAFKNCCSLFNESPKLIQVLSSFLFPAEKRGSIAQEVLSSLNSPALIKNFIALLILKNRIHLYRNIQNEFQKLVDLSKNTVRGKVITTEPLTDSQRNDLSRAFSKKFNKQVILEPLLNKEILGGLVVEVQGLTFDGSLRTAMHNLNEALRAQ